MFPHEKPYLVFQEEVSGGSNSGARLQRVSQVKRTTLLDPMWLFDFALWPETWPTRIMGGP